MKWLEHKLLDSSYLSVCLSACTSATPIGRNFMKFDIGYFYENL